MYNDYILTFTEDNNTIFHIQATSAYTPVDANNAVRRTVDGPPFPFDAGPFLERDYLENLFEAVDAVFSGGEKKKEIITSFREELTNAVFQSHIKQGLTNALYLTHVAARTLRLRLKLPEKLQKIPWELLDLHSLKPSDCERVGTIIIRAPFHDADVVAGPIPLPLRILVVVAIPFGYTPLDARAEVDHLLTCLQDLIQMGTVQIDFVHGGDTVARIQERIGTTPHHILHFIGHGEERENEDSVNLVFEDADHNAEMVSPEDLIDRVPNIRNVRLVFLNFCKGARASLRTAYAGIAWHLSRAGISAAVAHPFVIPDEISLKLSQHLYNSLSSPDGGGRVETGFITARADINQIVRRWKISSELQDYTPALYLPGIDLFTIHVAERPPSPDFFGMVECFAEGHAAGRWGEAVDYAHEALILRPGDQSFKAIQEEAQHQEAQERYLQEAIYEAQWKDWWKVLEWCDRFLREDMQGDHPDRQIITHLKLAAQMGLGVRDPRLSWKG